jgi:hypothetical protein
MHVRVQVLPQLLTYLNVEKDTVLVPPALAPVASAAVAGAGAGGTNAAPANGPATANANANANAGGSAGTSNGSAVGGAVGGATDLSDCIDWGTLVVYTCVDSCSSTGGSAKPGTNGAYSEEFVYRQPPE